MNRLFNMVLPSKRTRTAALCLGVTIVTFGAGVLFLRASPPLAPADDDLEYYTLAANVAAGHGFSMDGATPAIYRPPLFSALLGSWFRLTGDASLYSAGLFQSFMHSLACGAAFLLFLEVFGLTYLALGLSLWLGLIPPHLARVTLILQEPTLMFFTTVSVLLSLRLMREPSAGASIRTGAAWGLCTLCKSVSWFGPLLVILYRSAAGSFSFFKKNALILLLAFAAVLSPWIIRNYVRFNRLIIVNAQGDGMLEWNITRTYKQTLFNKAGLADGDRLIKEMDAQKLSDPQKKEKMRKFIRENAGYYIFGRVVSGFVYFTFPDFFENWYKTAAAPPQRFRKLLAYGWWILLTIPLYLVALYRCAQFAKGRLGAPLSFLLVFYLLYWVQYALIWGQARYSVPVYPVLLCLLPAPARRDNKTDMNQ